MKLFERVRELIGRSRPLAKDARGEPADLEIMAAAAVLLLEAAHGDEAYVWREKRALVRLQRPEERLDAREQPLLEVDEDKRALAVLGLHELRVRGQLGREDQLG